MKLFRLIGAATVALGILSGSALANYPNRPITIIVPWAAGGGTDAAARMIATLIEKSLGQPVAVVNRTGGNGIVGHTAIATAKPDGYTLGLITTEINMMHWMGLTDLTHAAYTPLAMMNEDPAAVLVNASSNWTTVQGMIDDVRANPGKFKATGTGQGGSWHLALAGLFDKVGVPANAMPWIPSTGAATGLIDVVAGGAHVAPVSLPEAAALLESGRLKALALMANERAKNFPKIPTIQESLGVAWSQGVWRGMVAPKGVDKDILQKVEAALEKAYNDPEYVKFMDSRGYGMRWMNGATFGKFLEDNNREIGGVLKAIGLAK